MKSKLKLNNILLYVIIIITILLFVFIIYNNIIKSKDMFEYDSIKLDTASRNAILHITDAKKCCGGAFLNDNSCNSLSEKDLGCVCCNRKDGYVGRPVHFEFTPLSDNNWKNPRCNLLNKTSTCSKLPLTPATL